MLTDLPQDLAKQRALTASSMRSIWSMTIRPMLTDALIEEHRADVHGKHSAELDMILNFLRSDPLPQEPRLVGVIVRPGREWAIGEHPRRRGVAVRVRSGRRFTSLEDVEHAVFLERLAAVRESFDRAETLA